MFKIFAKRQNIECKKVVCLDILTTWNSIYLMLCIVEKYERTFVLMNMEDSLLLTPKFED